jgi:tetratricopeptide (TPR) repeat protein
LKLRTSFILFFFLLSIEFAVAQSPELNPDKWVKGLSNPGDKKNEGFAKLDPLLDLTDSTKTFLFLNELWDKGKSKGYYFHARFNCLKSRQLYLKNLPNNPSVVKEEVKQLFSQAMHEAYESEDEYLIAFVSVSYGGLMYYFGETELSMMHSMNGVELYEKFFGDNMPYNYQSLGEMLYKIKEYKESVAYSRKALTAWEKHFPGQFQSRIMSCLNTTALGYQNIKEGRITIQVVDMLGKIIETRTTNADQTIQIGERYRPGMYIIRFVQGKQVKQLKLIKLPD